MKLRIVIADEEMEYVIRLFQRFVQDFGDAVSVELISDPDYFEKLFSTPQKVDILIASSELRTISIEKHSIASIFWLTEERTAELPGARKEEILYKYDGIPTQMAQIIGRNRQMLQDSKVSLKGSAPQMVVFSSASGGVGKTTAALGIGAALTKFYKRVLYIQASPLQYFPLHFQNRTEIQAVDIYGRLFSSGGKAFEILRSSIRREIIDYLPPFDKALFSRGLSFPIYERIAQQAVQSGQYDFVLVDAQCSFGEDLLQLFDKADKVVLVTDQSESSVDALGRMCDNIANLRLGKYLFLCGKFDEQKPNAVRSPRSSLKFPVSEYIEYEEDMEKRSMEELLNTGGFYKAALLLDQED